MNTKKVPCTAAPAGAPWTSFVAAIDEVARTPPGRIFPKICVQTSGNGRPLSGKFPDTGFSTVRSTLWPESTCYYSSALCYGQHGALYGVVAVRVLKGELVILSNTHSRARVGCQTALQRRPRRAAVAPNLQEGVRVSGGGLHLTFSQ